MPKAGRPRIQITAYSSAPGDKRILARVRKRFSPNILLDDRAKQLAVRIMKARVILAYAKTVDEPEPYYILVHIDNGGSR